jgi:glycosyltransferase involved in cell wall biosynthesis
VVGIKKIAIIAPSNLPVPAVRGGAIETLIQSFIEQNEVENNDLEIVVYSAYDKDAENKANFFNKTTFFWIRYNSITYRVINFFIRAIRKLLSIDMHLFDTVLFKKDLKKKYFDKIIVEGNTAHALSLSSVIDNHKLYFHVHANLINKDSKTNRSIIAGCEKIIVVSRFIKRVIISVTQATENQIQVLMNCIDLSNFELSVNQSKKSELLTRYGICSNDIVLFFAGRIVVEKGIVELIEALKRLSRRSFKLIVAGSFGSKFGNGDSEFLLRKRLDKISFSIRDKIIYAGYIKNSNIYLLHSICDIAVVPSIDEEAAGLVAIEAMASGLPLVVTNSGGLPEYVSDDCAIIVNRDENLINNLAHSIERLINDKKLRRSMGCAGKKRASQFSMSYYYNNFLKILCK